MSTLAQIKDNIQKWNEVRNTSIGLNFLTSGQGLVVDKVEFNRWDEIRRNAQLEIEDFTLHIYLGVSDLNLVFYVVDSFSDSQLEYEVGEQLFVKEFIQNAVREPSSAPSNNLLNVKWLPLKGENDLDPIDAMERAFIWTLYSDIWFDNTLSSIDHSKELDTQGVVRAFTVPFEDLSAIFDIEDTEKAFLFFGIKNTEEGQQIEFLLSNILSVDAFDAPLETYIGRDLTSPIPPFSAIDANLNLL